MTLHHTNEELKAELHQATEDVDFWYQTCAELLRSAMHVLPLAEVSMLLLRVESAAAGGFAREHRKGRAEPYVRNLVDLGLMEQLRAIYEHDRRRRRRERGTAPGSRDEERLDEEAAARGTGQDTGQDTGRDISPAKTDATPEDS